MSLAERDLYNNHLPGSKISFTEKVGYASGDLACNLIYQTVTTYLLFFYTDVYGISAAAAGTMFLVVRAIDAVTDPIMGTIVDKNNTKHGKFRPYLLYGAVPFAIIAILCFTTPNFDQWGKLVYAYITYTTLSLVYTLVNVPYGALTAAMTRDSKEIVDLTSIRMFFANLGGLLVSFGVPLLAVAIGSRTNTATGWQLTMTIMGIAGALLLFFCFKSTKERVQVKEMQGKIRFTDIFEQFKLNRPLVVVCVFFILIFGINSISNSVGIYFVTYNLGRPDMVKWYGLLGSLPALVIMPFLPVLNKALGKKNLLRTSLSLTIVGTLALFIIPKTMVPLILAARLVAALGSLVAGGFMWALIPETIEYGDYKTGKRLGGLIYAMVGFFFKFGMALGGIVPGLVLQSFGYIADQPQTQSALTGILITTTIIPALLLAVALVVINFYELDEKRYAEVVTALERRDR